MFFIDDILIYSKIQEHEIHLWMLFNFLMKENLNKNKIQSVDFACVKFTKVRKKLNGQSYIMNSFEIKEIAM